jgi:hypothetical protein
MMQAIERDVFSLLAADGVSRDCNAFFSGCNSVSCELSGCARDFERSCGYYRGRLLLVAILSIQSSNIYNVTDVMVPPSMKILGFYFGDFRSTIVSNPLRVFESSHKLP